MTVSTAAARSGLQTGAWLPEPLVTEPAQDGPEHQAEMAGPVWLGDNSSVAPAPGWVIAARRGYGMLAADIVPCFGEEVPG